MAHMFFPTPSMIPALCDEDDYSKETQADALSILDLLFGLALVVGSTLLTVALSSCRCARNGVSMTSDRFKSAQLHVELLTLQSATGVIIGGVLVINGLLEFFVHESFFVCHSGVCVAKHCVIFFVILFYCFTVLMMAVERYLSVERPLWHHSIKERGQLRVIGLIGLLVLAVFLASVPLMTNNYNSRLDTCTILEAIDKIYFVVVVAAFLVVTVVALVIEGKTLWTVQKHLHWMSKYAANPKQLDKTEHNSNLTLISFVVTLLYLAFWLPEIIYVSYKCGNSGATCETPDDVVAFRMTQHILLLVAFLFIPTATWTIYFLKCPLLWAVVKESFTKAPGKMRKKLSVHALSYIHTNPAFVEDTSSNGTAVRSYKNGVGQLNGRSGLEVIEEESS